MANGKFTNEDAQNAGKTADAVNKVALAAQSAQNAISDANAEMGELAEKSKKAGVGIDGMFKNAKRDVESLAGSIGR